MLDWTLETGIYILVALTAVFGLLLVSWSLWGNRHNRWWRIGLGVVLVLPSVYIQMPALGVAAVPLIGLVLVYWGLWGDRSKGRVRCPKCWYDMRGTVPKLECPECGHDAGQERRLHKTRLRWGRMVVGVVLVLPSAYPLAIIGGWWRERAVLRRYDIVPTTGSQIFVPGAHVEKIGPAWLVERLPDELGRFFERIYVLRVDDPAQLAACRSLRYLSVLKVWGDQLNDADLIHLKYLANLKFLVLSGVDVTDAGFVHLQGFSNLTNLGLYNTNVTNAGIAELQQALPNARITRIW